MIMLGTDHLNRYSLFLFRAVCSLRIRLAAAATNPSCSPVSQRRASPNMAPVTPGPGQLWTAAAVLRRRRDIQYQITLPSKRAVSSTYIRLPHLHSKRLSSILSACGYLDGDGEMTCTTREDSAEKSVSCASVCSA